MAAKKIEDLLKREKSTMNWKDFAFSPEWRFSHQKQGADREELKLKNTKILEACNKFIFIYKDCYPKRAGALQTNMIIRAFYTDTKTLPSSIELPIEIFTPEDKTVVPVRKAPVKRKAPKALVVKTVPPVPPVAKTVAQAVRLVAPVTPVAKKVAPRAQVVKRAAPKVSPHISP